MKKKTSYQKQKELIEKLRRDIDILVQHPNSYQATDIKMSHKMSVRFENAVWFGSANIKQ